MKAKGVQNIDFRDAKTRHSKIWLIVIVISICLILVVAVLGWYVLPLMLAKPTIKVDYVAEFNKLSRPQNFNPEKNAAPHYEKLLSELTSLPASLTNKFEVWPIELSAGEINALEKWGDANKSSLEELAQAAKCPYWWSEAKSGDGSMSGIKRPYIAKQRDLAWGVLLLAKYKASQDEVDKGLEHLEDLHMLGIHCTGKGSILEQMVGLAICELSYQGMLDILGRSKVSLQAINRTRLILAQRTSLIDIPRFKEGDFLQAMDAIQRSFTDDGDGKGRLIPGILYEIKKNGGLFSEPLSYSKAVRICLKHPDRKETLESYQFLNEKLIQLTDKSPWQLRFQQTTYLDELLPIVEQNYFLRDGVSAFAAVIETCWRGRVLGEAVETVMAILVYQAEKGRLPVSLNELVTTGYQNSVPIDPYSGKALVYKITNEDFILYSVGADFSDSGGVARSWTDTNDGGDRVFWPRMSELEEWFN